MVVIPAHNEQDRLGDCLDSVLRAAARIETPVRVVVALDSCTDGTALTIPAGVSAVRIEAGNVGAARRAGFDSAAAQGISPARLWYATTDADSRVPPDWLRCQLRDAAVFDVAVGTVEVAWSQRPATIRTDYEKRYRRAMSTPHLHVHGANLGVWGHWYRAVDGFAALPADEDVDLVTRLGRAGARVGWIADNPVLTSDRRDNRVRGGFAGYLDDIERAG
ncbi:hypothetical protein NRB56_06830 [Nocardia sp. RB56]|uniref:4,4'-diaponeurosporenoate glycosyltransferase n=1 Tax=Nocardia aurantia TaxID=2585199 RepID=A0A7K0DHJ8_9NOCA|nr:hypothetical protein [Nocardia aurantia]